MLFNFTGESLTMVCLFVGMGVIAFIMSLPYLCSKEVLREDEEKSAALGGEAK